MTRPAGLFAGEIVEATAPRGMVDGVNYTLTYDTSTSSLIFTLLLAPDADNDIEFYAIRSAGDVDFYIPVDSDYPVSVPFTPITHPRSWRGKEGLALWDATVRVGAVDDEGVTGRMIATAVAINTAGFLTIADSDWSAMEITDPDLAGNVEGKMTITVSQAVTIPAGLELRAAAVAAAYTSANRSLFHDIDASPEIAPGESVTIATGGTEGTVINAVLLFHEPEEGTWFQASSSVRVATLAGFEDVDLPSFTDGPAITGTGKIGTALTLDYDQTGADSVAIQWKRSGTLISGSTGSTYNVVAADDLLFIAATVTLTNAGGSVSATSNAIQATYAAPVLTGSISNVSETQQAGGSKTFDASTEFDATTGAYSVSPQNSAVTISSVTGLATVSLNSALAATTFTIFKTNSGGSASDTFTVTITASVPSITWPATDPTASDVTVTEVTDPDEATAQGFPDEDGHVKWVTSSFNFAPTGFTARIMPFDPSATGTNLSASSTAYSTDFAAVGATITPVVKWRHTASGTLKDVLTLPSIVIQGLDESDPEPGDFALVPTATLTTALTATLTAYNTSNISSGAFSVFSTFIVAYAAWVGQPSAYSRCLALLRNWCNSSRSPCGVAGFATKYEAHAVGAIVLAKDTPAVWDQLSSADKQRLDLIAKICVVAAAATSSDRRPSAVSGTTLLGRPANLSGNINFSLSYPTMVHLGCAYFGSAAALIDYLDGSGSGWSKPLFRAACNDLGLTNLVNALDAWTWTNAQVVTALTNPTIGGFAYSNIMGLMTASNGLPRAFGKTVRAGGGSNGQGVQFNGQTRGIIASGAAGLPNAGLTGMAQEFDGSDASEGPSSSNLRSAMSYVTQGTTLCMTWMLALATQGLLDRTNTSLKNTIRPRITIGIRDIEYKNTQGYNSFAHGGDGPGNENWRSNDQGQTYQTSVLISAWRDIVEPWIAG